MSIKVIGLTGKKQCGKSTLARSIIRQAADKGRMGCIYSFAKPLKEVCHILFGGNEANWYGDFKNEKFIDWASVLGEQYSTPRRILQTIGTDICRNHINHDFWLYVAKRYISDIIREETLDFVIIDDVRFDNEADFIVKNYNGYVYRVQRVTPVEGDDGHVSEKGVRNDLVDYSYTCADIEAVHSAAAHIVSKGHV